MTIDTIWLVTFFSVFVRLSATFLSSPLLGPMLPAQIRGFILIALTFALTPAVVPHMGEVPDDMLGLLLRFGSDILTGLLIGGMMHMLVLAFQTAGGFIDTQLGLASAQVFNPLIGVSVTPTANLKYLLAGVMLFIVDAHHLLIQAVVESYNATTQLTLGSEALLNAVINFVGITSLLALQIAAPVAGVSLIIDISASLINRAVPQTQPFLLALPAKLGRGDGRGLRRGCSPDPNSRRPGRIRRPHVRKADRRKDRGPYSKTETGRPQERASRALDGDPGGAELAPGGATGPVRHSALY
jgi:flagellar biosynthetic protein FliR